MQFFKEFGPKRSTKLKFISSVMWAGYLKVIAKKDPLALNVLEDKRWLLLKRPENLSKKQTASMGELLKLNLSSIKDYLLREDFQRFWDYQRYAFAEKFLENWVTRTLKTDLEPMKKVARTLRKHKPLILNWFKARGEISSGAVEGMDLKAI